MGGKAAIPIVNNYFFFYHNYWSTLYYEIDLENQAFAYREVYHPIKSPFKLSSQVLIRYVAVVADVYTLVKGAMHIFKPFGHYRICSFRFKAQFIALFG